MSSVIGFIILIVIVLLVAACGMWAAQIIASRFGRHLPVGAQGPGRGERDALLEFHSPNGQLLVVTEGDGTRDSGGRAPALQDVATGETLFALRRNWNAESVAWGDGGNTVTLQLRKVPSDVPGITLTANTADGSARFVTRAGAEHSSLAEIQDWLDEYARRFGA